MVVDMLTSEEQITPPEEDDRDPQADPYTAVLHCSDEPGQSSSRRRLMRVRMKAGGDSEEQQRVNSTGTHSRKRRGDGDEHRHRRAENKTPWSCKDEQEVPSLSSRSHDTTTAPDLERKDRERSPPAKRWVIGPLFQTFKSKMASFTEIVMSPVRLFKPAELPAGSGNEAGFATHEDGGTDNRDEKTITPKTDVPVVQRMSFDSLTDSDQNRATNSHQGHRQDSVPYDDDDGTFGLFHSANTRRTTDQPAEAEGALSVQQCCRPNRESISPHAGQVDGTNCVGTDVSAKAIRDLMILCEQKELTRHTEQPSKSKRRDQTVSKRATRLPTPAVRKRTGHRGLDRTDTVKRAKKEGTVEECLDAQAKAPEKPARVQTGKRRKVQGSDTGDVQISVINSSERQKIVPTQVSRSKRINDVTCTLEDLDVPSAIGDVLSPNVTDDSTPRERPASSGSVTWAPSQTARRRNDDNKSCEVRRPDCCPADPAERLRSSSGTSVSGNDVCRAGKKSDTSSTAAAKKPRTNKNGSNTRRVKRATDVFEDQGMSMSLTLKVGSGVDTAKDADSIMTCGITKVGEDVMLAERTAPDRPKGWFVYLDRVDRPTQEVVSKPGPTSSAYGSSRLKRSVSCPDITSLQHFNDAPGNDKTPCHPSPLKKAPHLNINALPFVTRTRRHTVCSVEIEREIAPLCLRKEVYPKWAGTSDRPYQRSPSKSFASFVSRFLSSPLAFLSKNSSRSHGDGGGYGAGGRDLGRVPTASSPSPSSRGSPASSDVSSRSAFFAHPTHTPERAAMPLRCSVFEAVEGVVQQEREENQQSSVVSEDKALSDSEIKPTSKQVEQRKVSSIRIRKTLPKPQYNLTPMGLPKAVRIKKKVFSVEEIYMNKNFSNPPEGRLETIFEVPLSRRDGSQSLIGPKRVKRFVEFPELGVARKLKRPVVGGAGVGGAPRKAAGNPGTGRTRRGREEEVLHLQDFDSLLCSKLNDLDMWMVKEQIVY